MQQLGLVKVGKRGSSEYSPITTNGKSAKKSEQE